VPDRVMYECRGLRLSCDESGRLFRVTDGEALVLESGNPLESWVLFLDRLDCLMRRRIGDMLARQGRSRHTGEELP